MSLRRRRGYTLIEAIMSLVLLSITALSVSAVFTMGLEVQQAQSDSIEASSLLRSQMEFLLSVPFANIASGTAAKTVGGISKTITWTVTDTDLDANGIIDTDIKKLVVELDGIELSTYVLNRTSGGKL